MCYWFTFLYITLLFLYMAFWFELNIGGRGEAVVTASTPINLAWAQVLLCTPYMG